MDPVELTAESAWQVLTDRDLYTVTAGPIPEMKALRDRCLQAGIPAAIACPGGGGCGPKTHLLVAHESLPAIGQLFADEWAQKLEKENLPPVTVRLGAPEFADLEPCPACGYQAPLVDGCCADCGIAIE